MTKYKIMLDDVYPQCCGYDLTEEEAQERLKELREKRPDMAIWYRVFTMDGQSVYW